jgi:hypothetical protein
MSCCGRQASEHAQVPQRRQARERAEREGRAPSTGATQAAGAVGAAGAVPAGGVPARLVFKGPRPLGLPVGARRVLVLPGQVVEGLTAAERAALWRTGLFE